MPRIPSVRRLFQADTGAPHVEQEVDDELRFHFDATVQELVREGRNLDDARREAARRFGDVDGFRAELVEIDRARAGRRRRADWWQALAHDVRYALRGVRGAPGFALVVALTLGLGIGANATMFGIVDRLLLRAPAYLAAPDATGLVYFSWRRDGNDRTIPQTSYKVYDHLRRDTRSFAELALWLDLDVVVGDGAEASEQRAGAISASLWRLFDMRPAIGRFFGDAEAGTPSGAAVAVLSWGTWQARFGGRADAIGKLVRIGGVQYTVIGVAPRGFEGFGTRSLYAFIPFTTAAYSMFGERYDSYNISWIQVVGRLRPGVTRATADADLSQAFRRSYAEREGRKVDVERPRAQLASSIRERGPNRGEGARIAVWLVGVAAIVLLVACANVANLLLARALRRRREIAIRVALGAGRARLLGQLLTESVLLALLGAGVGLVLAIVGGGVVRTTLLPDVDWSGGTIDRRMLGYAVVVALLTGLVTGLAPVWQARRTDIADALKAGTREGGGRRARARSALLVAQGALSVLLLVGAGLFVRSLHNVRTAPLGFDAERLLFLSVDSRGVKLDSTAYRALVAKLVDRAQTMPEVESATMTSSVPFYMRWQEDLYVPGVDSSAISGLGFSLNSVDPGYFRTTGTRILRGRPIVAGDVRGAPPVMVVSRSMARTLWGNADPLTKCVKVGADTAPCTAVVGIAEDIRGGFDAEPQLQYYLSWDQMRDAHPGIYVRTRGEATHGAERVRRALQTLMPGPSFVNVQSLEQIIDPNIRPWRLGATMFAAFGLLALLVAMVGTYSVLAYDVAQRTHELGVRLALGAQRDDVVRLVLGDGLRLAVIAIALGGVVALVTGRFVAPLLYGVSARDPLTFAAVVATLVVVAIAASVAPAWRASRVDPARALRAE